MAQAWVYLTLARTRRSSVPPDFVLSLREQEVGGDQRITVREEGGCLRRSSYAIIFIHGFGVSQPDAVPQWENLRQNLDIDGSSDRVQCGLFVWPSDQFKNYPKMLRPANRAGRALAAYLRDRRPETIVLVGHSLGARVAVQAAETLASNGKTLRGLVLLGAAVPVLDFGPNEPYEFVHARREAVGFSPSDKILKRWFRAGEKLAHPVDESTDAVGLRGHPEDRRWERWKSRSSDHSYWKFEGSANLTARVLDVTDVLPRPASWSPQEAVAEERSPSCGS